MPGFQQAADAASTKLRNWPEGVPVRLAKSTSNLFRGRTPATERLDLSAFNGVYGVDPERRTATVGGLTTYEDLVDATLPYGLVPLCVPQLRTITLGGAVTGMGIEAASFRNGCPHESVLSMDVLTGTGDVVHADRTGDHADLHYGFANSYGSLGYALRLEIELEPVRRFMALRHIPVAATADAAAVLGEIVGAGSWGGELVDYLDGTVFTASQIFVTVGRYTDDAEGRTPSDYTGQEIYYRSVQRRGSDLLTTLDYLWRWDTDWFWCSRAFGVQNPVVRRVWPASAKRSDFYWKIVALDRKYDVSGTITKMRRQPPREAVIQDVEIPLDALDDFMDFFHREVGISPVWLCPLRQRDPGASWPLYSFDPTRNYVNVGFWSSVARTDGGDPADGAVNRRIEREVTRLGGRKSLYSTSFYERDEFYDIYGQDDYGRLKGRYDPQGRLTDLYDKCVAGR
jgi:FAD/FMN-containing dehydrogenase